VKKFIICFFSLLIVCIIALTASLFFIDFIRFKPQIQQLVKEKANLDIDFSHIYPTLWTGLGARLLDVKIATPHDEQSTERTIQINNIKEVHITVEPWSLWNRPHGTVSVQSPTVEIVQGSRDAEKKELIINLSSVKLHGLWEKNKFELDSFTTMLWEGNISISGTYDGTHSLLSLRGQADIQHINPVLAAQYWEVDLKQILKGNLNGKIDIQSDWQKPQEFSQKMDAKGTFEIANGILYTDTLKKYAISKINTYLELNPLWQKNFSKEEANHLRGIPDELPLEIAQARFHIIDEKINVNINIANMLGKIVGSGTMGFDHTYSGDILYTMSSSFKDELIAKNNSIASLVDPKGQIILGAKVTGRDSDFHIQFDLERLQKTIIENTAKDAQKKIKDKISAEVERHPELKDIEKKVRKIFQDNGVNLNSLGL
jgi:hypothetical protein